MKGKWGRRNPEEVSSIAMHASSGMPAFLTLRLSLAWTSKWMLLSRQVISDQEFYDDVMSYAPYMGISLLVMPTRRLPLEQTVRHLLHPESVLL